MRGPTYCPKKSPTENIRTQTERISSRNLHTRNTKLTSRASRPPAFTANRSQTMLPKSAAGCTQPSKSTGGSHGTPFGTRVPVTGSAAGCSRRGDDDNDLPRSGGGRSRRAFDTLDAQVNCSQERRSLWLVLSGRSSGARLARGREERQWEREGRGRRDMPLR